MSSLDPWTPKASWSQDYGENIARHAGLFDFDPASPMIWVISFIAPVTTGHSTTTFPATTTMRWDTISRRKNSYPANTSPLRTKGTLTLIVSYRLLNSNGLVVRACTPL